MSECDVGGMNHACGLTFPTRISDGDSRLRTHAAVALSSSPAGIVQYELDGLRLRACAIVRSWTLLAGYTVVQDRRTGADHSLQLLKSLISGACCRSALIKRKCCKPNAVDVSFADDAWRPVFPVVCCSSGYRNIRQFWDTHKCQCLFAPAARERLR